MRDNLVLKRLFGVESCRMGWGIGQNRPPGLATENLSDKARAALRWAL